jgi:hypothetical protein
MTEEQIKAYLAAIDFDETHTQLDLKIADVLSEDLIIQVEPTK